MLVKIHPEQFRKGWDEFAPLVQEALPPEISVQRNALTNVLRAVLMERATPWVEADEEHGARAFILTTKQEEPITFQRNLLIYILTVFGEPGSREEWHQALNTLKKHGEAEDCQEMITYVYDEEYERYLSTLGFDTRTTLARLDI